MFGEEGMGGECREVGESCGVEGDYIGEGG